MTEGYLTTHVLDIYNGKPGSGIDIELYSIDIQRIKIKSLKLKTKFCVTFNHYFLKIF